MAVPVTFRLALDHAYISKVVVPQAGDMTARRAAERTRDRARANLKAADRMRTGALYRSITMTNVTTPGSGRAEYEVSAGRGLPDNRALFQEHGIGPVEPVRAKVLRFVPKGSSVAIFRPRTKGFKGAFYMRKAGEALAFRDFLP